MCWDMRVGEEEAVQVMKHAKDCITSLVVSDHKIIASSLDGNVRHYDIRSRQMATYKIGSPVTHIAQSRDEQYILASSLDGVIRLIHKDAGHSLREYKGHKTDDDYHIECGVLKNSKVISGSTEGCAIIWDLMDAKELTRLKLGQGVVHSIAVHPVKEEVLLATEQGVHIFGLDRDEVGEPYTLGS